MNLGHTDLRLGQYFSSLKLKWNPLNELHFWIKKMNGVLSTEELKIFCDAFFLFDEDKRFIWSKYTPTITVTVSPGTHELI